MSSNSGMLCGDVDRMKTAVDKLLECDDRPVLIARKSRSAENIVSSSESSDGAPPTRAPSSSGGKMPAPLPLPKSFACELPGTYRCHEASSAETPRHPGSGLSSSGGSHTSLLDSPEIISVS